MGSGGIRPRRIVAIGGGGFGVEPDGYLIDEHILALTGAERPRIAFLPTASGDDLGYVSRFFDTYATRATATWVPLFQRRDRDLRTVLLDQDAIFVGGGNTANMLATWRVHEVDVILREAWERGTVLAGVSAGAICWFTHGVTDSYGLHLERLDGGLGFIDGSFCPHYDSEELRKPRLRELVEEGLPAGWACDDGAALVFDGAALLEAVASRPEAGAYRLEPGEGGVMRETPLPVRSLGG